jgi:hypothetical protein
MLLKLKVNTQIEGHNTYFPDKIGIVSLYFVQIKVVYGINITNTPVCYFSGDYARP